MRMICMYQYKKSNDYDIMSKLAPIPKIFNKFKLITDIHIKKNGQSQKQNGTNKSIIPPNTDIIIGNVKIVDNNIRIPLCKTVMMPKKITSSYFEINQCALLEKTSPKEYAEKWLSLGCPYSVKKSIFQSINPSTFNEIKLLRDVNIPYYSTYTKQNSTNIPLTRKEYKKIFSD